MREGFKKKKNSIVLSKLGIICISIIVLMNIIGVGYGSWQSGVEFQSTITTGSIDPVFVECEIEEEEERKGRGNEDSMEFDADVSDEDYGVQVLNEEIVESVERKEYEDMWDEVSYVEISDDKKQMNVFIKNAYPGYSAKIRYRIENQGTIPITCKVNCETVDYVKVDIEEPGGTIYGFGDFREGVIDIELEDGIEKEINQNKEEFMKKGGGAEEESMEGIDAESEDYGFAIDLVFEQYNISD
jgi:hypothetical protein